MKKNAPPEDSSNDELYLFPFPEVEEDEEDEPLKPRSPYFRIIAFLILLAFIALSFPLLTLIDSDRIEILKMNSTLNNDPIVQDSTPAIVSIEVQSTKNINTFVRMGTGFCISSDGQILTNNHVIKDAHLIKVEFSDGSLYYSHRYRQIGTTDLAIIDLNAEDLPTLSVDFDSMPVKGDLVTVIGNPLGFKRIADRGIVGDYHLKGEQGTVFDIGVSVRPGSSGSPVINQKGQVIGVVYATTDISSDEQSNSIALAIPLSPYRKPISEGFPTEL